jgi:acyl-[acyl-carrier-protein]-phospholipid O-acyltransferase / long-chain-fatty-acid--[acyl-carrier-protein] ligase
MDSEPDNRGSNPGSAPAPPADHSFAWLNATQFLGALNDNIFKAVVSFFLIGRLAADATRTGATGNVMGWTGIVFALPFLILLPIGGALADRLSKRTVVIGAKVMEAGVMAWGAAALALPATWPAASALALMAAQSALFGPTKYGIIPELVPEDRLSLSNGRLIAASFLAIVLGSAAAPALTDLVRPNFAWAGAACLGIALLGIWTATPIRRLAAAAGPERRWSWGPGSILRTIREVSADRELSMALWASAYFSLIGAFMQLNLVPFGRETLGLRETHAGYIFIAAALGIGAGSLLAGRLSGRHIEFGIVPAGAGLMALSCFLLAWAPAGVAGTVAYAGLAGLGSGLYIVPLDAFLQWRSPPDRRGAVLAANGFLSWLGIAIAGGLMVLWQGVLGWSPARSFGLLGLMTVALAAVAIIRLPDFLIRFLTMLIVRSVYRVRTEGVERVPSHGPALLVANHVSWVDALLILSIQPRRVRFLMHRGTWERSRLRFLFRLMGVIPIASDDPPRALAEALRTARRALDAGYLVCIFAEGALTRTGMLRGFRPGFERIVRGTTHPIIPVYLGGLWGSIFSHYYTQPIAHRPTRWRYPVSIHFGAPLPPTARPHEVRQAVMELACGYFERRKARRRPLAEAFARVARRHWARRALCDTGGRELTYGQTLIGALALAERLRARTNRPRIGILLPPSAGGALANLAVALLGRTAVNLNFTVSREAFESSIAQAGLDCVVTAQPMLDKFPALPPMPGVTRMEDLAAELTTARRLRAALKARFAPARSLVPGRAAFRADDTAALIFSSGTTGEPKGIALSHDNIASNCEGTAMVLRPRPDEALAATLPLFHSFGYMAGFWLPLLHGIQAAYHTSPLDAQKVGEMVRTRRCTVMFSTPTFLLGYLRRVPPEDFRSLRLVVTGAEKLRPRMAAAFRERYGVPLIEGYGTTELSPVAALSLPDADVDGMYQAGAKEGSVGQPIPGVAAKIVHPETGAPCAPGEPGLLLIRGPNVMTGYWGRPDLTAEAVVDGWYRTGDVAAMDEEGFIFIQDRLARFSKIGGEMVPHGGVEDAILQAMNTADRLLAVTGVPCERRGEKLVVVYTPEAGPEERLRATIGRSELPNLWKPAAFVPVDALPMTGTGKLDVRALKAAAMQGLAPAPARPE